MNPDINPQRKDTCMKIRSLFLSGLVIAGLVFSQLHSTSAFATADSYTRNSNGMFTKQASDGLFYPAQVCYSTDGNQGIVPCREGGLGVSPGYLDSSSTSISASNGSYVQVISATSAAAKAVEIYNGSSTPLSFGIGAASSEVEKLVVAPSGWTPVMKLFIPSGSRLSVRSKGSSVNSGVVIINLVQ